MSCLTQHKTKQELSDWLMNNASDNETIGFLDMLVEDIWEEKKKLNKLKERVAILDYSDTGKTEKILELYAEIKKLKEESKVDKEFQEEVMQENKKLKEREYEMCQIAKLMVGHLSTDSEEESESDEEEEEE